MRHSVPNERLTGLEPGELRGLFADEVAAQRARYGSNDILSTASAGWRDVLHETARDPMLWFLAATAVLFAWLGDYAEAITLAVALLPIVGMDAFLHRRTQASTAGLADRLAASARVVRDGKVIEILAPEIVPGDLALVLESQPFPADGILLAGDDVQVDESALTGESLPVRKRPFSAQGHGAGLIDAERGIEHETWVAAGTRLLTGEARMRVVFTGRETLYGQIVRSAQSGAHERTPLQQALAALVFALLVAAGALCLALAATRYYQGHGALDALLSAVTLAVAALPEEFPVVLTLFLSVGVYRLARRQALVRRAVVVENIGRITCICTDKTGTITEGRLQLAHVLAVDGVAESELLRAASLASRPGSADPMDIAILDAAPVDKTERTATFPFTEDRKRETAVLPGADGGYVAAAKGAPETILAMTAMQQAELAQWQRRTTELAATGHKVIACAVCRLASWSGGEPDRHYTLLGLLAFEDPVRPTAREAVGRARDAGIRVIMLTGDHPATAAAIAREVGIGGDPPCVVDGPKLAERLHAMGPHGLDDIDAVARCAPAQKLELVHLLRAAGERVAVTGDGVNDVPALQGADVGIAMGERGTRSAREVASIVLLDDDFRTIIRAIAEGRQLFENLKRSFAYLLMVHIPLVLTAAFVPFAGFPLLYLPVHIVWLEIIIHPTALLVFQQLPSSDELAPVSRRSRLRFFEGPEWALICAVGAAVTLAVALGYVRGLGPEQNVEHARSIAMVSLIVASATITAGLSRFRTRAAVIAVTATLVSACVLVQVPVLARALHVTPLHRDDWLIASAAGLVAGALAALLAQPRTSGRRRSTRA